MKKTLSILAAFACALCFSLTALAVDMEAETEISEASDSAAFVLSHDGYDPSETPDADSQDGVMSAFTQDGAAVGYYGEDVAVTANANELPRVFNGEFGRGENTDIDKYWAENGYPEDVSYACCTGGAELDEGESVAFWEIGLVNADEDRKQEILELISPDCNVTFFDCQYSHAEREAVLSEVRESGDANIADAYLGINNEYVFVCVPAELVEEYTASMYEKYDTAVMVTDGKDMETGVELYGAPLTPALGIGADGPLSNDDGGSNVLPWAIAAAALLLAITAFAIYFSRRRMVPVMQTADGAAVSRGAPVSKRAAIDAVKKSEASPSDETFEAIMKEIDKTS